MSHDDPTLRPQTEFIGATDPELGGEALRSLVVDPDTPVEIGRRRGRRVFAFARAGLLVVTISGLTLVPAATLAEDVLSPAPLVQCELAADGTLVGPDGAPIEADKCEDPPAVPPEPASTDVPATPTPPVEPEPEQPAAQEPAEPASAPATPEQAPAPEPATTGSSAQAPAPAAEKPAAPAAEAESQSAPAAGAAKPAAPAKPVQRTASGATPAQPRPARATPGRHGASDADTATKRASAPAHDGVTLRDLLPSPSEPVMFVTDEPVIPSFLIGLYKEAGRKYDIPWVILAAINEIETDFGRNVAVSSAGARGWMQFMPATWSAYGVDADNDGARDPNNPRDAIFAAARYLRASGAPQYMRRAIFAYNHAGWYVDSVLMRAERIAAYHGVRSGSLRRLLSSSRKRLVQQVLADERITIYGCGREDIEAGRIDRRVLVVLRFLAWSGLHPTVTSLQCGHGVYTTSGNISAHSYGAAVDIAAINGVSILGNQGQGSVTDATIRELLTLKGAMAPNQIISLMAYEQHPNTIAMSDHADHIHVGFPALRPLHTPASRKLW